MMLPWGLRAICAILCIGLAQGQLTSLLSWVDTFREGGSAVARRLILDVLRLRRADSTDDQFIPVIIGGVQVTSRAEVAFMSRLSLCSGGTCYHICGGAIVSPTYVVTAGHCSFYPSTNTLFTGVRVTVGDLNLYVQESGEMQLSATMVPHPNYNNLYFYRFDVALARLGRELTFGPKVAPINLPTMILDITHRDGIIPGWGRYDGTPGTSTVASNLQMVDLRVLSLAECQITFADRVTAAHVCYGGFNSTGGICNGDSGGPVIIYLDSDDQTGTVIAVNSFVRRSSTNDCPTDKPGVGTRLSYHLDFINSVLSSGASSEQQQTTRSQVNPIPPPFFNSSWSPGAADPVANQEAQASTKFATFLRYFFLESRMLLFPSQYGFRGGVMVPRIRTDS